MTGAEEATSCHQPSPCTLKDTPRVNFPQKHFLTILVTTVNKSPSVLFCTATVFVSCLLCYSMDYIHYAFCYRTAQLFSIEQENNLGGFKQLEYKKIMKFLFFTTVSLDSVASMETHDYCTINRKADITKWLVCLLLFLHPTKILQNKITKHH